MLARQYQTIARFLAAKEEDLQQINDIGPVVAKSIVDFISDPVESETIAGLLRNGVEVQADQSESTSGSFSGQIVVVTGTLAGYSRDEAHAEIEKRGGKISAAVSKNTTMVVVGENAGSKLKKARALGIRIVDEDEFVELLKR